MWAFSSYEFQSCRTLHWTVLGLGLYSGLDHDHHHNRIVNFFLHELMDYLHQYAMSYGECSCACIDCYAATASLVANGRAFQPRNCWHHCVHNRFRIALCTFMVLLQKSQDHKRIWLAATSTNLPSTTSTSTSASASATTWASPWASAGRSASASTWASPSTSAGRSTSAAAYRAATRSTYATRPTITSSPTIIR